MVLFGGAGIVSSRAVEERTGSSTPLSRFWLYSHSFAPYCFHRKTVGRKCNYIYQSKRPSEVDAPGLSIHHPTKIYTSTIKQNHQTNSDHQAPKAFFGFLARLRPHTTGQPRNALKRIPQGLVGSSFSKRTSIVRFDEEERTVP